MANKKTTRNGLIPFPTPSETPDSRGRKHKVYTSGTLHEQETGRYMTPGMDAVESADRPLGHGKKASVGKAAVTRGQKAKGAQRGVGQETVDGFFNKNAKSVAKTAMKNRKKPPRRR